jgi:DNA-binding NarL/FixJ family response regulator
MSGIEATSQIMKGTEGVSVLILSMHSDDVYVRQGLKAGAKGYLLKDSEDLDLIKAVKSLARGGSYFSPSVSKVLLAGYLTVIRWPATTRSRASDRERSPQLISKARPTKRSPASSLSINTVEPPQASWKLDLHNTMNPLRRAKDRAMN